MIVFTHWVGLIPQWAGPIHWGLRYTPWMGSRVGRKRRFSSPLPDPTARVSSATIKREIVLGVETGNEASSGFERSLPRWGHKH